MPSTKKIIVVPKLSAEERRYLLSMGFKTFVKLAEQDPIHWKYQLRTYVFTPRTSKKSKHYEPNTVKCKINGMCKLAKQRVIRDKLLLNIYHYKSHVDKGTRLVAGLKYLRLHPNASMPPML